MPVVKGMKSESEKFAGALRTYSIEALMGDGRALQAGTSHNLGQNFAKAFDITFQARDKSVQHVWGTSWGVSTRLIGAVDHDPRRRQRTGAAAGAGAVSGGRSCRSAVRTGARRSCRAPARSKTNSSRAGIRVTLDDRDERPGWKFSEWELRGVPLRLEIGPKDIEKSQVVLARRDTREKAGVAMAGLVDRVRGLLDEIQRHLLERARTFRDEHTQRVANYDEFKAALEGRPGFVVANWCGEADCEAQVKADTQATIRNMPIDAPSPAWIVHPLRPPGHR